MESDLDYTRPLVVHQSFKSTQDVVVDYEIAFGSSGNSNLTNSEYEVLVRCPCGCNKVLNVHVN